MKRPVKKLNGYVVSVLLSLWIVFSLVSVVYNTLKIFPETKQWFFLSDLQKRQQIFGDIYDFLVFIEKNTSYNSDVAILSADVKTHYLSLYYLYPRKIVDTSTQSRLSTLATSKKITYIATYNNSIDYPQYEKIASFSSTNNNSFGHLYKIK